jgi:hypothetical protein
MPPKKGDRVEVTYPASEEYGLAEELVRGVVDEVDDEGYVYFTEDTTHNPHNGEPLEPWERECIACESYVKVLP